MTKETSSSSEDTKGVAVAATDEQIQQAAEDAASKIAEIVSKHEADTAMAKYYTGKAIWDVLKKEPNTNYLSGGDTLFAEVAKRVMAKTGAENLAPRTLRQYASMAKIMTVKEMKGLLDLPKFAFSKLKAVLDLFNVGRVLQKGEDVDEAKAKALEFLEKNAELNTHQLRQVYQDAMTPPSGDGQGSSGESGGSGVGGSGGGGGGAGDGNSLPKNIYAVPQKIGGSMEGLLDSCGSLVLLLKNDGGPKFKSDVKRDNFVSALHEARDHLVQVADTAESAIQEIDTWEKDKFQASLEKSGKPGPQPADEPKKDKKDKKDKKGKKGKKGKKAKKVKERRPPPTQKTASASTIKEAMEKGKKAKDQAAARYEKRQDSDSE